MKQPIKAVIFDLGRVLVDIDNRLLVEKLFKGFNADDVQELGRRTMSDPAMVAFNTGRIEVREFHQRMHETYGLEPDFEIFKKLWCNIFMPMEGMEELVGQISSRVPIGLLSDTDPIHWNHIRTTWPWIDKIANPTLSYQVGVMKPDAEVYLAAARNVNTPPEHCLFIDDLQVNIDGAKTVGMKGIRFESPSKLKQQIETLLD